MHRKLGIILATAGLVLAATTFSGESRAAGESGVKTGFLTCTVDSGWGFIFGSSRSLKCSYARSAGVSEHYQGKIQKFGVDIGYMESSVIVWAVFAPTADVGAGALAGTYAGATGSAAVGAGAGGNVLFGGSSSQIQLQPVSLEGGVGLNVAGGILALNLDAAR